MELKYITVIGIYKPWTLPEIMYNKTFVYARVKSRVYMYPAGAGSEAWVRVGYG